MGLNYSYEIWVPRASLFDFFARIAHLDGSDSLDAPPWDAQNRLDSSIEEESYCLSFRFEADETLRAYDLEMQQRFQEQGEIDPESCRGADGRYAIGCIWTSVNLRAGQVAEPSLAVVSFTAATTAMSLLFTQSPSIRRFFLDLTRESGAAICVINREDEWDEPLFLEGQQLDFAADNTAIIARYRRLCGA